MTPDMAPTPREYVLRDELARLTDQAQELRDALDDIRMNQESCEDELAALLAPYPVGTVVEECYLRGHGMARHQGTRRWQLEKASFRNSQYGTTMEYLGYMALLIRKDGTPGMTRQRIAATTLVAGTPGVHSTTTWRVVEGETP